MMNYETLIYNRLTGATPKEKYDKLIELEKIIDSICYPRRGIEDDLTLEEFANRLLEFSKQHRDEI